jgi:hypothetical protein
MERGSNHIWVKEIQICSNEELFFLQRRGDHEMESAKIFSRTTGPEKYEFIQKLPDVA